MKALGAPSALVAALAALAVAGSGLEDEAVQRCWEQQKRDGAPPACIEEAAGSLAPSILEGRWSSLGETERARFRKALAIDLDRRLDAVTEIEWRPGDDPGTKRYRFRLEDGRSGEARLSFDGGGELEDVVVEARSTVGFYREECDRVLDRYSLAQLVAELDRSGVVVLEDFEDDPAGAFPSDWSFRGFGEVTEKPYRIAEEEGNRFLRAEDRGENVMLYRETRWSSRKYPYLSWRWRIRAVPEGADQRVEDKADSAAGIYLSYRRKLGLVPETVKFVFSGRLDPGVAFRRPGIGMPWTVVAASGSAEPDRWQRFVYRTASVYRKTFEGDPGGRPLGIGLLTDANNTGSLAAADYDDILALERAQSPDTLRAILDLEE